MTDANTDTLALTREQIKAMRAADSAVWRWDHASDDPSEHTHELDLGKEVERGDGFGRETLRVQIRVPARVANYGNDRYSDDGEDYSLRPAISGSWVQLYVNHDPAWITFAHFVRVGDALEQEWVVDNRNQLLKRARLTAHELKVRVIRPAKDGRSRLYTFNLDECVRDPFSLGDEVRRKS